MELRKYLLKFTTTVSVMLRPYPNSPQLGRLFSGDVKLASHAQHRVVSVKRSFSSILHNYISFIISS